MFRALPIEGHKNIIQPAIFGVSRWLPFEGEKRNLSKWFSFRLSRCLPDGREIFKIIHKNRVFVLYLLEGKIIFRKSLIFSLSRDLPLEGNLQNRHNFWPLPVGTSEEIFKTEVKKRVSRWLLFGREIFWKHPAKWLFSLGISEEKKFHQNRTFCPFSVATLWGDIWKPLKKGSLPGDM